MSENPHVGRYRKKPVEVDAMRFEVGWTDEHDVRKFFGDSKTEPVFVSGGGELVGRLSINTLEGNMTVSDGDYVIKGVQGECYPCKPDIFEATYELVE
jgi:hypothetical protein